MIISIHTTLAGGDLRAKKLSCRNAGISIHTTLAGGDSILMQFWHYQITFQSTPPSRVATRN